MKQNTIPNQVVMTEEEYDFIQECAERFDTEDLSEVLKNGPEVYFDFTNAKSHYYFEIEPDLRAKLQAIAKQRGIRAEMLLNEWVREKTAEFDVSDTLK